MYFKCTISDPELDNLWVLIAVSDSETESSKEENLKEVIRDYVTMKPFLDKYGLVAEYSDKNNEKIDFSEDLVNHKGAWVEIAALPLWEDISSYYQAWVKDFPWMRLDPFETFDYPLYWQYSRHTRKRKMLEELEN